MIKEIFRKFLWYFIGILENKMDNTTSYEKANRLYSKMQRLKNIAYDL